LFLAMSQPNQPISHANLFCHSYLIIAPASHGLHTAKCTKCPLAFCAECTHGIIAIDKLSPRMCDMRTRFEMDRWRQRQPCLNSSVCTSPLTMWLDHQKSTPPTAIMQLWQWITTRRSACLFLLPHGLHTHHSECTHGDSCKSRLRLSDPQGTGLECVVSHYFMSLCR
jgi:hypothetical protein